MMDLCGFCAVSPSNSRQCVQEVGNKLVSWQKAEPSSGGGVLRSLGLH